MRRKRLRLPQERARYVGTLIDAAPRHSPMHRPSVVRARYANRGHYVASGGAYLFFCGCVAFTVALLTLSGFVLPQRALPAIGREKGPGEECRADLGGDHPADPGPPGHLPQSLVPQ